MVPLYPGHWHKVNPYARRVKTLRRSHIMGMTQVLSSLKLYDRGAETPCIFPKLQCLVWNYTADNGELPLIANLFFSPTLKELNIGSSEGQASISESSFLVPLHILSEPNHFPVLAKLSLPFPAISGDLLKKYHAAVMDLLCHLPNRQLEDVSLILTEGILHHLGTLPKLRSLELYDLGAGPSDVRASEPDRTTTFKNLESLSVLNLRSLTSLAYLDYSHCVPSCRMKISFTKISGQIDQNHGFYQVVHLISRKTTLEVLKVEGSFDFTAFLEPLLALPNMKELYLGPGIKFDIQDDTLRLVSTRWNDLTHFSVYENQAGLVSIGGIASLYRCPIQSLRLSFTIKQDNLNGLRRQIKNCELSPLHSLKHFYLADFVSDGNATETVFVLTYLFPHAKFIPRSDNRGATSNTLLQEVLRIRSVVLDLLDINPDFARLTLEHMSK